MGWPDSPFDPCAYLILPLRSSSHGNVISREQAVFPKCEDDPLFGYQKQLFCQEGERWTCKVSVY
jgi:hypothetical protein